MTDTTDIAEVAARAAAAAQPTPAPTIETAAYEPAAMRDGHGRAVYCAEVAGYAAPMGGIGADAYDSVYELDLAVTKRAKYHAMVRHAAETLAAVQEIEGSADYMSAEDEVVAWAKRVAAARASYERGDIGARDLASAQASAPDMADVIARMDSALARD